MELLGLFGALLGFAWLLMPLWSMLRQASLQRRVAALEQEAAQLRESGFKLWEEVQVLRREVQRGAKASPAAPPRAPEPASVGAPREGAPTWDDVRADRGPVDVVPAIAETPSDAVEASRDRVGAPAPPAEGSASVSPSVAGAAAPVADAIAPPTTSAAPVPPVLPRRPPPRDEPPDVPAPWRPLEERPPSAAWTWWETHVVGNWTGILGAVAVVLGVSFLGVYAALAMSPASRFGLVVAAAAGLAGLSALMSRRAEWQALALWVRSAAAAVLLMGCVASVLFTPMQWVQSPSMGLLLVVAGVAVNLGAAVAAGGQAFAAVHVVQSLVALGMLPASSTTLVAAAVVAACGELLVLRHPRWGVQLAVSAGAFTVWHGLWALQVDISSAPPADHLLPVACVLGVGLAAFVTSYARVVAAPEFRLSTFALHLGVEGMIGLSLLVHDLGGWVGTGGLALAAAALHRSSAWARDRGVAWLSTTDRLVALGLATAAAGTLSRHGVTGIELVAALGLPSLVWLATGLRREVALLVDVPLAGAQMMAFALMLTAAETSGAPARLVLLAATGVAFALLSAWGEATRRVGGFVVSEETRTLGLGLAVGFLALGLNLSLWARAEVWAAAGPALVIAALVAYRRWAPSLALEVGLGFALAHFGAAGLVMVGMEAPWNGVIAAGALAAPALAVALPGRTTGPVARGAPLILVATAACVISWRYLVGLSSFLPGVVWVLLAVAWFEAGRAVPAARAFLSALGAATFAAFLVRHGLVDLQGEATLGPVTVRGAVELYAAAAAGWCLVSARGAAPVFGWMLEVALGLVALFVALEVPAAAIAPTLSVLSLLYLEGGARSAELSRLVGWAVVMHAAALVRVAVLSSRLVSPDDGWLGQGWFLSLVALGVAMGVFLRARTVGPVVGEVSAPPGLGWVGTLARGARSRPGPFFLYPWFAALALFLAWTFSHGVLTLLWMMECFGMFVAAIALRDEALRRMAMFSIVVVLGRLLLYDLAGSDVLVKALVFLGSGGLLIGINALYHRFRERFGEG